MAHERPGLIEKYAQENNIELTIMELWKPFVMPNAGDFNALIILGGPMGVYESGEIFPSKKIDSKRL